MKVLTGPPCALTGRAGRSEHRRGTQGRRREPRSTGRNPSLQPVSAHKRVVLDLVLWRECSDVCSRRQGPPGQDGRQGEDGVVGNPVSYHPAATDRGR